MEIQYFENNETNVISITINQGERDTIMEVKRLLNYQLFQIKVRTMDGRFSFVSVINIYYIEAVDGRCYIYDKNHIYIALDSFQKIKKDFLYYGFLQCNKTQIVNTYHLKEVEIYKECQRIIILDNYDKLQVSRKYKNDIDAYNKYINPF